MWSTAFLKAPTTDGEAAAARRTERLRNDMSRELEARLQRLQYSIEESADLLSLSRHTLARDIRRGIIRAQRYGRRILIPREELERIARDGLHAAIQGSDISQRGASR